MTAWDLFKQEKRRDKMLYSGEYVEWLENRALRLEHARDLGVVYVPPANREVWHDEGIPGLDECEQIDLRLL